MRYVNIMHRDTRKIGFLAEDGNILHQNFSTAVQEHLSRKWPGMTVEQIHASGHTAVDVDGWVHVAIDSEVK